MQKSCEIRWFFHEEEIETIDHIKNWYLDNLFEVNNLEEMKDRVDYYYKIPSKNLGIKIREEKRLEIKEYSKPLDTGLLKNIGEASEWMKFSFLIESKDRTLDMILNIFSIDSKNIELKDFWLKIMKKRILLKYNPIEKKYYDAEKTLVEGCGIEFTQLKICDTTYYSLGLESFSSTNIEQENLNNALKELSSLLKNININKNNCFDYPEFLLKIQGNAF